MIKTKNKEKFLRYGSSTEESTQNHDPSSGKIGIGELLNSLNLFKRTCFSDFSKLK